MSASAPPRCTTTIWPCILLSLAACAGPAAAPTPANPPTATVTATTTGCAAPAALTPALTEGPYFKEGAPERTALAEGDLPGQPLSVTGYVLTTACQPVAGARLDVWQADVEGVYDNTGYQLRGYQLTDAAGRYAFTTIVPGLYPGRTEHIHIKIQTPAGQTLTTQLFFPAVKANAKDRIFDEQLLLLVTPDGAGLSAAYTFIVAAP